MLTIFITISLVILLIIWDYLNKKERNKILKKSGIYGSLRLPLIGGALHLLDTNTETVIKTLRVILKKHNKIFHTWIFHQLVIFCADPKILEPLFTSPALITKNYVYDILSLWLGDGLLMSSGKKWQTRRKIITPSFHFKILENFVPIFDQQTNVMIQILRLKFNEENQSINIFPLVRLTALDIIAQTAMGVEIKAQFKPNIGYAQSIQIVLEIISARTYKPHWRTDFLLRLFAPHIWQKMMKHINRMREFNNDIITKRRCTLAKESEKEEKKHIAFLDLLLQTSVEGKPLSNKDICEEVETFMFTGHDTITSGISFTLYAISRHREVQNKLFAEIRKVMGDDKNQMASYRQLQDLRYMDCVIKESLRLYPPVPIIGRYFKEDTDLNGLVIPGNSHLNIPLCVILRDPDYFQDPHDFKPERFASGMAEDIFPFAYIPFSAGPRNCIGQKYAMLKMKSVISKILRHYELLPKGPEVVPVLGIILSSKNGVNLGLKAREYNN